MAEGKTEVAKESFIQRLSDNGPKLLFYTMIVASILIFTVGLIRILR